MSAQENFLQYMGVAGATVALLFGAQAAMRSAMDVSFNADLHERPANAELVEMREAEAKALETAGIEKSMTNVAKSRTADSRIAPKPSTDLSAMSGWVQTPDYTPYEPNVVTAPAAQDAAAPSNP